MVLGTLDNWKKTGEMAEVEDFAGTFLTLRHCCFVTAVLKEATTKRKASSMSLSAVPRVGQNGVYKSYTTVHLHTFGIFFFPKNSIYTIYMWFWPALATATLTSQRPCIVGESSLKES